MKPKILLGSALAAFSLCACNAKGSLDQSQVELVRVEGQQFEVRVARVPDMKDTWRLMIVRATIGLRVDPDEERMRAQNVAKPFMARTCKGAPYSQLIDKLQDDVNYYTVFTCGNPG
jgi:hypothetical protein